jgi:putative chitinase
VTANKYAHKPEMIANRAYANRMGNGDEASGDGAKFCGRGLIQLTGRANQQAFAASIKRDINLMPEFLATIEGAVQSACWFWKENKLNQYADTGDILTMTKRINGGTLGLEERKANYARALKILGA